MALRIYLSPDAFSGTKFASSETLRQKKDCIINQWLVTVRHRVRAASFYDDNVIIDSLPEYLDELAVLLSPSKEKHVEVALSTVRTSREHARQRTTLAHYTLEDVLLEHDILQDLILRETNPEDSLTVAEVISKGVRDAAVEFMHQQLAKKEALLNENHRVIDALQKERELREQFVAALTHDLRQPLSSARVSAQLLQRDPDGPSRTTLIARTLESLNRIERMVGDLLDATQIRAGHKLSLVISECDLAKICQSVTGEVATSAGDRFVCKFPEGTIRGFWDEANVSRALSNLLSNAVKYGDPAEKVEITFFKKNDYVHVAVSNRGSPLSAAEQRMIFMPYYRANSARHTGKKGWGLGLTLVKGIAEAHGGDVSVSSDGGVTTFTLILPIDARQFVESTSSVRTE
ncbi:MAG TPA: HAMP domain-containing sensor histidine kinase [Planctomycetota bacterium]|nr:HAMP domain-containing sensor histidine kinase [Planctomycetota bacterium]